MSHRGWGRVSHSPRTKERRVLQRTENYFWRMGERVVGSTRYVVPHPLLTGNSTPLFRRMWKKGVKAPDELPKRRSLLSLSFICGVMTKGILSLFTKPLKSYLWDIHLGSILSSTWFVVYRERELERENTCVFVSLLRYFLSFDD